MVESETQNILGTRQFVIKNILTPRPLSEIVKAQFRRGEHPRDGPGYDPQSNRGAGR